MVCPGATSIPFMAKAKYVPLWHPLPLVARDIRQRNRTFTPFTHFLQFFVVCPPGEIAFLSRIDALMKIR